MIANAKPANYNDLESMVSLRQQAKADPQGTLRQVAKHFESVYLNMMLKSMRQASIGDPIFDSNNSAVYRDMYDSQIALNMSEQNGIGIADMLVKQLQGGLGSSASDKQDEKFSVKTDQTEDIELDTSLPDNYLKHVKPMTKSDPINFSSHNEFVETLMPYAEEAADELDITPQVLIAQAALETGWGKHVQTLPNGESSYNVFNIKADSRWNGEQLKVNTLEYRDGIAQKERASFRVYDSYQESFRDYVDFIKNNPRYEMALETTADPEAYAKELQQAGYATDPHYADKVIDIYQREVVAAPFSEYLADG